MEKLSAEDFPLGSIVFEAPREYPRELASSSGLYRRAAHGRDRQKLLRDIMPLPFWRDL